MKEKEKKVNIPEVKLDRNPFTKKELKDAATSRLSRINKEFTQGFNFINKHKKSVTFFGSARFDEKNPHYKKARSIASKLSKEGFAIVTGGGPGIMEAANRGAYDVGGISLGFNIKLPYEQVENPFVTDSINFYYFFSRKVSLSFSAEAFVYFPGGFGTLDEFFEILTLIQTNKISKMPLILVGKEYWGALNYFIQQKLYSELKAINKEDMNLYTIIDDEEEIVEIIKKAPLRDE